LWLAMLVGPILTIEVPVGAGRVLSISAFDGVVFLTFIVLCRPYRWSSMRGAVAGLWPMALFGALAVAHSIAFLAFGHDIQVAGLLRETMKYVGYAANLAMLVLIFRTDPMDRPPPRGTLALAAVVIGLGAMAYTWTPVYYLGGSYVTVIGATTTVIAFLLVTAAPESDNRGHIVLTAVALAAALTGIASMWSKFFLLCTAACALIFVLRIGAHRFGIRVSRPWLAAGIGIVALALLTLWLYTLQDWRFRTSATVRFDLWGKAADLAWLSFPWGIGLGQFGAWLASIHYQASEVDPIRFVHNQFLAFMTEAGAVGILFILIIAKLVIDATRAWRGIMVLVFVGVLVGALMLHDGIGLRALQLLLGYSIAVAVRPGAGGSQRHCLS
jgi:hypothetical protein